tara:strand:+ start:627 stop:815 length:189 start_codon:yes stop_codon:yes gene_type:complete
MDLERIELEMKRMEKSAKRVVTQKLPLGGINDFCNLVKLQQNDPNLTLQEAFESVVYLTKFN